MVSKSSKRRRKRQLKKERKRLGNITAAVTGYGPPHPYVPHETYKLLANVAVALNDVVTAGVKVELAANAVITDYGYIFDVGPDPYEPWEVRTRMLTEVQSPESISESMMQSDELVAVGATVHQLAVPRRVTIFPLGGMICS